MLLLKKRITHSFRSGFMFRSAACTFMLFLSYTNSFGQMTATFTTTPNTNCNGSGCNYTGPSILINEIMMSPNATYDGSLFENGSGRQGEWIELYNPNICEPVDISCYYLGNNATDIIANQGAGLILPAGTIIPPAGFCVIRGVNATPVDPARLVINGGNTVEIVPTSAIVCMDGTRLWFPNAGSWFAFYDNNGVAQDAVTWGNQSNLAQTPCRPTLAGCNGFTGTLASYNQIPAARKNVIAGTGTPPYSRTVRRIPDGGNWDYNVYQTPTQGSCNDVCATPSASSCAGVSTINVTGGTAPYTYHWNDSEGQLTQTASGLCAGTFAVTVTDNLGVTAVFSVVVADFIPPVSVSITDQVCIDAPAFAATISPVAAAGQTGAFTGPGLSGTTFNPQNAGAGTHTLSYVFTDEHGCANTATDQIVVNPLPVVSITGINPTYCVSTVPVSFNLQPAGGTLSGPGVSNNAFVSATAGVGTHTLTYSYTDPNGCFNSITANVQVVAVPSPSFIIPDKICNYAPAFPLAGTPAGGVFSIDGETITNFSPATEGDGVHSVLYTYTDANNCIATSTETINVLPRPALSTNLAAFYCYKTGVVALSPSPAGGTLTGDFVVGTGLDLAAATPGNYSVTYEYADANGCENTLTKPFLVTSPLTPDFTYSSDCFQKATFINATQPALATTTYNWSFINGAATSTAVNPVITYEQFGDHTVSMVATDSYNCPYPITKPIFITEGVSIKDYVIPNVITANGDGINDVLELPALLEECIQYKIFILNRWGNLVYEMNSAQNAFSGLDKGGKELMPGVYFYIVESDDIDCKDEYKGFCSGMITIVR